MPGPVFRQEMLSVGRRSRFITVRTVIGFLMLIVVALTYAVTYEATRWSRVDGMVSIREMSQIMAGFYITFAIGTLIGVIGITPAIVAGAISSERERRTIEYLFTTHLTNSEIILDKVLARLLTIGQMILVTLPILAILRFMGGVPGQMLLWHFVILFSTAMMCLALSLVASTWNERTQQAISNAYGLVFLWLISGGILYALGTLIEEYFGYNELATPVFWIAGGLISINPFMTLLTYGGLNTGSLGLGFEVWQLAFQCVMQVLVSLGLIALCAFNIRRVHIKNAGKASKSITKTSKIKKRISPFQEHPMLWKEMYTSEMKKGKWNWLRQGIAVVIALAIIIPMIWTLVQMYIDGIEARLYVEILTPLNAIIGSIMTLSIGTRAAGAIPLEKERDTWLSLMATPISAQDILWAKLMGTLYAYRWHFGALLFLNFIGVLLSPLFIVSSLAMMLTIVVTSSAAAMIGIRTSLGMESSSKAITTTTMILLTVGGGYMMLLGPMLAFSGVGEAIFLLFTPCVPYHYVFPTMLIDQFQTWNDEDTIACATYAFGMIGYLVLSRLLFSAASKLFDAMHGRETSELLTVLAKKAYAQSLVKD